MMAPQVKPLRSRDCQDRPERQHEERRHEVCWRIVSRHDVSNPNQSVTPLRNDPDRDHEDRVASHVRGRNQKCHRHRQVEDATDLYLPHVERGPRGNGAEEPARKGYSSDTECEMGDAPNGEQKPEQSVAYH